MKELIEITTKNKIIWERSSELKKLTDDNQNNIKTFNIPTSQWRKWKLKES